MDDNQPSPPADSAAVPPVGAESAAAAPAGDAAEAAPAVPAGDGSDPPAGGATPVPPGKRAKAKKEKKEETWWDTLRFLLWLFLGAVVLRTFLFAPFSIPSGSMMPNLLVGDYLFVSKWSYGYSRYSFPFHPINFDGRLLGGTPERGDVVVFRHPGGRGLGEARDRPARRHDRGARRRRHPERPADPAPADRRRSTCR